MELASHKNIQAYVKVYQNVTNTEWPRYNVELGNKGFRLIRNCYTCKILTYVGKALKYFEIICVPNISPFRCCNGRVGG
jgi:hypothetical protein